MPFAAGARLGPYEIQAPLGAGGMGEVYRARDTRLGRSVAVKVLPAERSASADARARFEREAKAISQLSHPHICALFDVGREGETDYLVMELLEGETLEDRLARGPLPIADVVRYGGEIAGALAHAHAAGIVHRDLKPGNVVLTSSGVKLVDFGLARLVPGAFTAASTSTLATAYPGDGLTAEGLLVGTLSYMAPEQVEGRGADARADLFALGCVLYQMLTGRRPFEGTSPAAVAAAILRSDPPPVGGLRPGCPPALDRLVAACLVKDPAERWQSAHDVNVAIATAAEGGAGAGGPEVASVRRSRWLSVAPWLVAVAATALVLVALLQHPRASQPASIPVRFSVPPPQRAAFRAAIESLPIAVSPDGSQLAMIVGEPGRRSKLWLRKLDSLDARPLGGTEGAMSVLWSPDSKSLAFVADAKLQRLDLGSEVVQPLCDVREGIGLHGTWSGSGQILFATVEGQAISRVSASGGTPVEVARSEAPPGPARVQWPSYLPDGRFVYLARYTDGRSRLLLGEAGKPARDLGPGESMAEYVDPGWLVFARAGTLFAQRFELRAGRLSGEPFAVAQPVSQFAPTGWAMFSASRNGVLAYASQRDVSRLTWFDRAGRATKLEAEADALSASVGFSSDGQRALFARMDPRTAQDVWMLDVVHGVETRLVSGPSADTFPVWLPGGRGIVYGSVRGHPPQLILRDLGTGAERELAPPPRGLQHPLDVTPDGRTLVFAERTPSGAFDIFSVPLPAGGTPTPLLQTPFDEEDLRLSPDGRFAAFTSNESGNEEVYLARFPELADKVRVSKAGGLFPRWRADGRELFYLAADGGLMSVAVRPGTREFGQPRALFRVPGPHSWAGFDVAPDGQRFLAIVPEVVAAEQPLTVAVDAIPDALQRR